MKIEFLHVHTVKAKGRLYYYYRHKGKRIKLIGSPGTKEFALSYDAAREIRKAALSGFHSLIADYFGSVEFQSKAPRTQSDYLKHKAHIETKWARQPVEIFDDKRIRRSLKRWHQELVIKLGSRQADLVLATMRVILSHAVDNSTLSHNYVLGIKGAYKADRSDAIWTLEDVEAFMASANRQLRLAALMALNLGRREGDLIRLAWADYDGMHIAVTNRKGGKKIKFRARCTHTLKEALDAYRMSLGRVPHKDEPILTTVTGKPWVESHFSTKFSAAKNKAGLNHLHFHDLRGTAITVLAEQGCTHAEIASISGHSTRDVARIIDRYMAMTGPLNEAATAKLNESWIASVSRIE
jgi:integrase